MPTGSSAWAYDTDDEMIEIEKAAARDGEAMPRNLAESSTEVRRWRCVALW